MAHGLEFGCCAVVFKVQHVVNQPLGRSLCIVGVLRVVSYYSTKLSGPRLGFSTTSRNSTAIAKFRVCLFIIWRSKYYLYQWQHRMTVAGTGDMWRPFEGTLIQLWEPLLSELWLRRTVEVERSMGGNGFWNSLKKLCLKIAKHSKPVDGKVIQWKVCFYIGWSTSDKTSRLRWSEPIGTRPS